MRKVAVVVQDGAEPFGLGAMCEVWAEPYHPEDDNPVFDFVVCTPRPGRVRGASGYDLYVEHGLHAAADADLVCLSPKRDYREPSPEAASLVRAAHDRGAYVFAHCSASFILGEAGLLDGRECTTHWRHTDELAEAFPEAKVKPEVLYVEDDRMVTGAGSAAGIDAALHLMRTAFGGKVAADAARRMVLAPHRDGGQAQFIRRPMPECTAETLTPLLLWVNENLDSDLSVESLAARAAMSPRTFARRFVEETGATPHGWITAQRVRHAETLLEGSDLAVERIAHRVGFTSAATLRHQFSKVRGISPQEYRRRFSCA
ncbi:MAG: GlxA family transcriptional regulator [Marmoricola sp.]